MNDAQVVRLNANDPIDEKYSADVDGITDGALPLTLCILPGRTKNDSRNNP